MFSLIFFSQNELNKDYIFINSKLDSPLTIIYLFILAFIWN